MSGYRTIVAEVVDGAGVERTLRAAEALAQRFDALLVAAHVWSPPYAASAQFGEAALYVGPELQAMQRRAADEVTARVAATFTRICGNGEGRIYRAIEGDRSTQLTRFARTADLVVLDNGEGEDPSTREVVEQVALGGGVPVLMLPDILPDAVGQTVMLGWDGSREAARAAHDALPFLTRAQRVVLCTIGDDPAAGVEAAAAMLQRHGLGAAPEIVRIEGGSPGQVLCEQAAQCGADLLVMGAYGHSRLREMVFGGATRHVLTHATTPVLLSS